MSELLPWSDHLPTGVDPATLDLVAGRSLIDAFRSQWTSAPDAPALVDRTSSGDGRTVTAGELDERSAVAARRLRAAGIEPGAVVLVSGATSVDFVVAYLAVLRAGATVLAVNSGYTEREVATIVADARPRAAITDVPAIGAALGDALVTTPGLDGLPAAGDAPIDTAGPDDVALLIYTSGTTGTPKGVPMSHANLLASAEAVRLAWRWTPEDRLVLALPLYHMHGLGVGLHGTLVSGASAVVHDRFDPGQVIDAVTDGASMFFGVPTMWTRLASHPRVEELATLRLGVSGSAPLPPDLHMALAVRIGRPPLERYGMSETAMLTSNPYDGERRAGSVGFPLPGVDARLAGGGEIEVRGPNVFRGYLHRPEATAEAFDGDWFRTGDLGEVDADGYLHIVGRSKELIISGGFNVFPREVEDVLRACPGVVDACVVGVPDPEWGERVTAFVVGETDEATLHAWVVERLVTYKRPRRWERIDEVPRNAMGKMQRDVLVRRVTGS